MAEVEILLPLAEQMMSILEICEWIQNTPSSTATRESLWVFPT